MHTQKEHTVYFTSIDNRDYNPQILKFIGKLIARAKNRLNPKFNNIDVYDVYDQLVTQGWRCALSGKQMTMIHPGSKSARVPANMSIDRIDNTMGYIPGNIQVTQWTENNKKRTMTQEQYLSRKGK